MAPDACRVSVGSRPQKIKIINALSTLMWLKINFMLLLAQVLIWLETLFVLLLAQDPSFLLEIASCKLHSIITQYHSFCIRTHQYTSAAGGNDCSYAPRLRDTSSRISLHFFSQINVFLKAYTTQDKISEDPFPHYVFHTDTVCTFTCQSHTFLCHFYAMYFPVQTHCGRACSQEFR